MPSQPLDRKGTGLPGWDECQEQNRARHVPTPCLPSLLGSPHAGPALRQTLQTPLQRIANPKEADMRMPDREPPVQMPTVCLECPVAFRPPSEDR